MQIGTVLFLPLSVCLLFLFLALLQWLELPAGYWIRVVRVVFIKLSKFPSNFFLGIFTMNRYWILSNAFLVTINIIWFFFFSLLICIPLIDFWFLNKSWIPKMDLTRSWCIILLLWCWILFVNILLRIFAMFMRDSL